jgi:uncharacterized protein (TIGR02266 family)
MMENLAQVARFTEVGVSEVRRAARYAVDLDVTMGSEHNFYAGFVENVSQGGIFIATHISRAVGDLIEFSINLPGLETVRGVGEVRWVRVFSEGSNVPPGLGLRFVELSPGAHEGITEFLKNRDPLFYDED